MTYKELLGRLDGAPDKLRSLAHWFDAMNPNDKNPEVQNDLRAWADTIEDLIEEFA